MLAALPNLVPDLFHLPDPVRLRPTPSIHAPRILLLYGSLRERYYSKLLKFTLLTRDISAYLTDRYSERKESAAKLHERMALGSAL